MKEITMAELLELMDPEVHDRLKKIAASDPTDEAMVYYQNVDMCSSQLGKSSVAVVGPSRGIPSLEAALKGHLNDLPSQRQYPQSYVALPGLKSKHKEVQS